MSNVSYSHGIYQVRQSEVLMAKDSPTVPDGEVDVVPGKDVTQLSACNWNFVVTQH